MSESFLGSGLSGQAGDDAVAPQPLAAAPPRRRATDRIAEDSGALTRFEQEQLAREFADIERASAVLRLGEPALQSWTKPSFPVTAKKAAAAVAPHRTFVAVDGADYRRRRCRHCHVCRITPKPLNRRCGTLRATKPCGR
jgi:hypothetical protein